MTRVENGNLRMDGWRRHVRTVGALLVVDSLLLGLLAGAGGAVLRARGVDCRRVRSGPVYGSVAAWAERDPELG